MQQKKGATFKNLVEKQLKLFIFILLFYFYSPDSLTRRKLSEQLYINNCQAIILTCFRRCQDIAV